jgi:hypothetical protein
MSATRVQLTVDCRDPDRQARFWEAALHYTQPPVPEGFASWSEFWRSFDLPEDEVTETSGSVVDPDGTGPRIFFQPVPETKRLKNRLHLDLAVSGGRATPLEERRAAIDAEADRLEAVGASTLWVTDTETHYSVTMADPEGNEFCLH